MWGLSQLAEKYGQRASDLLGISDDPFIAWDFDQAVFAFVRHVESELDQIKLTDSERKGKDPTDVLRRKKKRKLEQLLGIEKKQQPVTIAGLEAAGVLVVRSKKSDPTD